MAYRYGNRNQINLFPESMEDYIAPDDPVRAYDAFIEALDFKDLGITLDANKVGNSEYHPHAMLKLLVYGYSYGIRSSRKLERATHTLFLDGTKIRANASIGNTWTKKRAKKALKHIDENIQDILNKCDMVDEAEQGLNSLVTMDKALEDQKILQSKVKNILKELQEEEPLNTTDPECIRIRKGRNFHAGFNFQSVVDEKEGLILSTDVVRETNDLNQFACQIEQANQTLDTKCLIAVADCGYASTDELEKIDKQGIKVIVPSQRQALRNEPSLFAKEHFAYQDDYYLCPQGQKLTPYRLNKGNNKVYKIIDKKICLACPHYGVCTTSPTGRTISRLLKEEIRQRLETQYEESPEIYQLRKQKVELPFGHIKHNLKVDSFLLRGLKGVKAEASILATCFNLARMITLLGVPALVRELNAC